MARPSKLIQFYMTDICNSRCNTCHIWENKDLHELPSDLVASICARNKDSDIVLGGGEFTLYRDRHKLLYFLDVMNINYTVLSNAVSYKLLSDLIKCHDIKNLTISFDGLRHDSIRGINGNIWSIIKIIKKYRNKIPNLKLSYTYSALNEDRFIQDMDYIKNTLGFDKIYFCIAQDMDLLKTGTDSIVPKNLERILDRKEMLYDKDRRFVENLITNKTIKRCDSTDTVFTVYTNGNVVRCQSYMNTDILGNIYEDDFNNIIKKADRQFNCKYDSKCKLLCQRRYD